MERLRLCATTLIIVAMEQRKATWYDVLVLGSVAAFAAACFAVLLAVVTKLDLCDDGCVDGGRTSLLWTQLAVAVIGLVPAWGVVVALTHRRRVLAAALFGVSLLIYLAWGLFNDAAVHGWDNLRVFP